MKNSRENPSDLVVVGASRGLGRHFAEELHPMFAETLTLSRSNPQHKGQNIRWAKTDLAQPDAAAQIAAAAQRDPIDLLIYNAACWHDKAFGEASLAEIEEMITVNVTSAIALTQTLWPQLTAKKGSMIVFIGSTSGLDNSGSPSAAYVASKFGLRGLAHAVREQGREHILRVSVISPGGLTADQDAESRVPYNDMSNLVACLYGMSPATCPKEIVLPATQDTGV